MDLEQAHFAAVFGGSTNSATKVELVTLNYLMVLLGQRINDLNKARYSQTGCGSPTSSLCISGYGDPPGAYITNVESWNGTSWTEIADVNNTQGIGGGAGALVIKTLLNLVALEDQLVFLLLLNYGMVLLGLK